MPILFWDDVSDYGVNRSNQKVFEQKMEQSWSVEPLPSQERAGWVSTLMKNNASIFLRKGCSKSLLSYSLQKTAQVSSLNEIMILKALQNEQQNS